MADETLQSGDKVTLSFRAPLVWIDDQTGYRCPLCAICVAVPKQDLAGCPRCEIPADEVALLLLAQAGFDETDQGNAVDALRPFIDSLVNTITEVGFGE